MYVFILLYKSIRKITEICIIHLRLLIVLFLEFHQVSSHKIYEQF